MCCQRPPQFLDAKLHEDVEGTCSGQFGYIITVLNVNDIGKGTVLPGSGLAEFIVKYSASESAILGTYGC